MPSSISSSEQAQAAPVELRKPGSVRLRHSLLLIAFLTLLVAVCEFGARVITPRISRVEGRMVEEYRSLFEKKPGSSKPVAAFVGNSLLGAAIEFEPFAAQVAEGLDARRFFVDNTGYYDWRYGLHRLFLEGARPQYVMLMITERQLLGNTVRGDYFAHTLLHSSDLVDVAQQLDLHPTDAASYAFANVSAFYGKRGEIRKVILGRIMPDLPVLTAKLVPQASTRGLGEALFSSGVERLRTLDALCKEYGARFVLLPAPQLDDPSGERLTRAAAAAGVRALVPFEDAQYGPEHFRDGFHLHGAGTAMYTAQLTNAVREEFTK